MKKTKNPIIWLRYLCWCVQNWMSRHTPYYPLRLRIWLHRLYPDTIKSYPWYIGADCQGPFVGPWHQVSWFFRSFTGGRSHRCEFTDKKHGVLYGHNEGAFMDQYFENISISDMDHGE